MQTWEEREGSQDAFLALMKVQAIADAIDQLRSEAKDVRLDRLERPLEEAWYHAEKELREITGECSSLRHGQGHCECCREFERLRGTIRV